MMFNVLDPSELDTPTPFSPLLIMIIADNASGVQFPAAKSVEPTTASGICNVCPVFDEIYIKISFGNDRNFSRK